MAGCSSKAGGNPSGPSGGSSGSSASANSRSRGIKFGSSSITTSSSSSSDGSLPDGEGLLIRDSLEQFQKSSPANSSSRETGLAAREALLLMSDGPASASNSSPMAWLAGDLFGDGG